MVGVLLFEYFFFSFSIIFIEDICHISFDIYRSRRNEDIENMTKNINSFKLHTHWCLTSVMGKGNKIRDNYSTFD